jgi:hypothetical protein
LSLAGVFDSRTWGILRKAWPKHAMERSGKRRLLLFVASICLAVTPANYYFSRWGNECHHQRVLLYATYSWGEGFLKSVQCSPHGVILNVPLLVTVLRSWGSAARAHFCGVGTSLFWGRLQGINLLSNAYVQWALGPDYALTLAGILEMPRQASRLRLDFSSLLGPLFFTWVAQLLLPVIMMTLVYEKQNR